jgi:hypothetical protein
VFDDVEETETCSARGSRLEKQNQVVRCDARLWGMCWRLRAGDLMFGGTPTQAMSLLEDE